MDYSNVSFEEMSQWYEDEVKRNKELSESPWISVEDELPKTDDEFLVTIGSDVVTCYFNPWTSDGLKNIELSYMWFTESDVPNWGYERVEVLGVTHWMPLPDPPVK